MAYRDFKLQELQDKFGVQQQAKVLFPNLKLIPPSDWLIQTIQKKRRGLRITTEKAVSEAIISAVLIEIQERNYQKTTLFSGENLLADKQLGLNGEVDFMFVKQPEASEIVVPVISITEAKLNLSIEKSKSQAIAQMLGAQYFNNKSENPISVIHGVVTNGTQWLFMRLDGKMITVDENEYLINDLASIIGVFQAIIDFYK
jgi:co-chaperonin GroES (HSP10)